MNNKSIEVVISYDGFSITYKGERITFNQEDDLARKFIMLFNALGLEVEITEEY